MGGIQHYILTSAGEPVPCDNILVWGIWMASADADGERRIGRDTLPGDVTVSTIFLGIDRKRETGLPILFETLVMGGPHDGRQRRYCTRAEALAGHQAIVAELRGVLAAPTN